MAAPAVRVIIIDDHEVVRRGLALLLEAAGGMTVCGEGGSVAEAGPLAARCDPDVAIVDLRLADGNGVEAGRAIRASSPRTRVLVLTAAAEEHALLGALLAGASGYLLKDAQASAIVAGVRNVAAGRALLDPADAREAMRGALKGVAQPILSKEVAELLFGIARRCESDHQRGGRQDRDVDDEEAGEAIASLVWRPGTCSSD